MPTTTHADRLWILGGAVGAALILALGYFFLISPQYDDTAALDAQAVGEQARVSKLQDRLGELREQNANLAQYKATLAGDKLALPSAPDAHEFLLQLKDAAANSGSDLTSISVGAAGPSGTGSTYAIPVAVQASGSSAQLEAFLREIQEKRPRAVLVDSVSANADSDAGAISASASLTVSLRLFTAPGALKATGG